MKKKLFSNIKTLTSVFSVAILIITVIMLMLRLTVFSPYKEENSGNGTTAIDAPQPEAQNTDKVSIAEKIVFKDFNATANPQIESAPTNEHMVQVKIIREDNKSLIYSSDYIKPGLNKRTMKLEGQPMEKGEYLCKAEITVIDKTTSEIVNVYSEPVTIVIEQDLPDKQN